MIIQGGGNPKTAKEVDMTEIYDIDDNKHTTPCDIPDDNGSYHCPYADTYAGYEDEICRVCCGLGVDE